MGFEINGVLINDFLKNIYVCDILFQAKNFAIQKRFSETFGFK